MSNPEQPAGDELDAAAELLGDGEAPLDSISADSISADSEDAADSVSADSEDAADDEAVSAEPELGLEEGEHVADVTVQELLGMGGGVAVWRAARADGGEVVVLNLMGEPSDAARDRFLAGAGDMTKRMAEQPMAGILAVGSIDPIAGAYVGEVSARGTLEHIPASGWTRAQKVELMIALCGAVGELHRRGIVHGCIRPELVLLDGDKQPVVANARGVRISDDCRGNPKAIEIHRAYAGPELRMGRNANDGADVYALGRVLQFMLTGEEPDEVDEKLPRLDTMKDEPEPLVGVIRRATAMDPEHRYANADELATDLERYQNGAIDLGYAHPDRGGRLPSVRPPAHAAAVRVRKTAKPSASMPPPAPAQRSKGGWTPLKGGLAAAIGVALIAVPTMLAYFKGIQSLALMIVVALAAIPLAGVAPSFGSRPTLMRAVVAVGIAGVLSFIDPAGMAGRAQHQLAGLKSPKVEERVKALQERVKAGDKVLIGVDLAGANLAGMRLDGLELDGVKLTNANCKGTTFQASSLINADVTGADFSGAVLVGTMPEHMTGWEQSKCDDNTTMPAKWRCTDGAPVATP